jgi:hypothetical protein
MLEDECVIPAKAKQVPLVRHAGWRKGFGLTDRRTAGGSVVSNAMPDIVSAWFGISLVRPLCWPRSILEQHAHPTDAQEAFHVVLASCLGAGQSLFAAVRPNPLSIQG